jgi:hypothetical protein
MPQLASGRHVALGEPGLIEAVNQDDEKGAVRAALIARTSIQKAWHLAEVLPVIYFDESQGTPPDCPRYPSGWLVYEVLEGRSDWTEEEVAEFRAWMEYDPGLQQWLSNYLRRLDEAIRNSPRWRLEDLDDFGL